MRPTTREAPSRPRSGTRRSRTRRTSTSSINSTTYYDNDTDYSDDYDGSPATNLGNPCFLHTTGDDISAPGYWTDVKVKERDLPSLFGTIGLPLSRNGARARVDVRPAISGHRFLPLAVPDNIVTKVQVRYYRPVHRHRAPEARPRAAPERPVQTAYQAAGRRDALGLLPSAGTPTVGDRTTSVASRCPRTTRRTAGSPQYRPIGEQVRLASSPNVNLDSYPCAHAPEPLVRRLLHPAVPDPHLERRKPDVEPRMQRRPHPRRLRWAGRRVLRCAAARGHRLQVRRFASTSTGAIATTARSTSPRNFTVSANGIDARAGGGVRRQQDLHELRRRVDRARRARTTSCHAQLARHQHDAHVARAPRARTGSRRTPASTGPPQQDVHRTVVGVDSTTRPSDPTATGAVESVHTSLARVNVAGDVGPSFDNWHPSSAGGAPASRPARSTRRSGSGRRCRAARSRRFARGVRREASSSHCDPNVTARILDALPRRLRAVVRREHVHRSRTGGTAATQSCPPKTDWFSLLGRRCPTRTRPATRGAASSTSGGQLVGQAGDWMAVATDNCNADQPGGTQCQDFKTTSRRPRRLRQLRRQAAQGGRPADPNGWVQRGGDSADPRVVSLFVVPYQALKNVAAAASQARIPILRFASFYVMNWRGQQRQLRRPVPRPGLQRRPANLPSQPSRQGHDSSASSTTPSSYEPGPVDPNAICREDDPTPCRVTLVR